MFLDTTRHVKIWFTRVPDHPFGNDLNARRLVAHRENNPHHEINLIVNLQKLSQVGREKLSDFCDYYKIFYHDVLRLQPSDKGEATLISIIAEELCNPYGNEAAASDITRTLRAVLKLGIYSDFDFEIQFSSVPKIVQCGEFLIPYGECVQGKVTYITPPICFLAFPDIHHPFISAMQEYLLSVHQPGEIKNLVNHQDYVIYRDVWAFREKNLHIKNAIRDDIMARSGGMVFAALKNLYRTRGLLSLKHYYPRGIFLNEYDFLKDIAIIFDNSWDPTSSAHAAYQKQIALSPPFLWPSVNNKVPPISLSLSACEAPRRSKLGSRVREEDSRLPVACASVNNELTTLLSPCISPRESQFYSKHLENKPPSFADQIGFPSFPSPPSADLSKACKRGGREGGDLFFS